MIAGLRETFEGSSADFGEGLRDFFTGRETRDARAAGEILGEMAIRGLFLLREMTKKK